MVGRGALLEALDHPDVTEVLSVGRREVNVDHPRLRQLVHKDFEDFAPVAEELAGFDACFWCLGVSSAGMDEAKYARITHDYTMAAAKVLFARNPDMRFCFVSGVGTDDTEQGRVMWARIKGKAENSLKKVGFRQVVLYRPGYIQPKRGVKSRVVAYRVLYALFGFLYPLLRLFNRATSTVSLGRALLAGGMGLADKSPLYARDINRLAAEVEMPPEKAAVKWRRRLVGTFKFATVAFLLLVALGTGVWLSGWTAYGASADGERLARMENSPQWKDGQFHNTIDPYMAPMTDMLAKTLTGSSDDSKPKQPFAITPRRTSDYDVPPESGLRATWLGHCTTLIEIDGYRVLFDPVWGDHISPFTWAGPERFYEMPLALEELPEIDAIAISHDHYDHLDHPTIVKLKDRNLKWFVPLGVGAHLEYWGVPAGNVIELDWWDEGQAGGLTLTLTPARHFSGRSILMADQNETLWGGWAVTGTKHRVFFSGDTALHPELAEIGERLGPFDLTMIDTGAYDELWPDVHLGPEQAVIANQLVRGKVMLPVGWGTFDLANHAWTEPVERAIVAAAERNVALVTPEPGAFFEPTVQAEVTRWWPETPWSGATETPAWSTGVDELIKDK